MFQVKSLVGGCQGGPFENEKPEGRIGQAFKELGEKCSSQRGHERGRTCHKSGASGGS